MRCIVTVQCSGLIEAKSEPKSNSTRARVDRRTARPRWVGGWLTKWRLHGAFAWWLYGGCVMVPWWLHDGCMVIAWRLWWLHGGCMGVAFLGPYVRILAFFGPTCIFSCREVEVATSRRFCERSRMLGYARNKVSRCGCTSRNISPYLEQLGEGGRAIHSNQLYRTTWTSTARLSPIFLSPPTAPSLWVFLLGLSNIRPGSNRSGYFGRSVFGTLWFLCGNPPHL